MRRSAHFEVFGRLDGAARAGRGRVTVENGIFRVRPSRRRRTYDLPLDHVADMVCQFVIRAEVAARKREKREAKSRR